MRKWQVYIMVIAATLLVSLSLLGQRSMAQKNQPTTVKNMVITGEIAMGNNGYIIRGKVPAELFTILNPDPDTLDPLVKSGRTVNLEVRIVSGDNVEIEAIDSKLYGTPGAAK